MRRLLLALCALPIATTTLLAQRTHLLLISGLGGEPAYSAAFAEQARGLHALAATRWQVADSSLIWLAEDTSRDTAIRGRSTKEEIERSFGRLATRVAGGDLVVVVLIGHGSGEGAASRVNVPGVDPTAADYATWLSAFPQQNVLFVNTASASGDFAGILAGRGRVVITATRTAMERNETTFATHFLKGLSSEDADANKDGQTTALEAFDFAKREVARAYEAERKLLTERAQVSDTTLAATIVFGRRAGSDDPRIAALVAERRALEGEVATLRDRRATMTADAYEAELERLLLAIAAKTQAIRAAGGGT
jgi:hypothetical protein